MRMLCAAALFLDPGDSDVEQANQPAGKAVVQLCDGRAVSLELVVEPPANDPSATSAAASSCAN